jgi:thiol-disulfide isomerase/thioredoxin
MDNIYEEESVKELIKNDFIIKKNKSKLNSYNVFLNKKLTEGNNGILVIYAPWCENCVISKNMWENLGKLFKYKFKIYALNTYNFEEKNQDMMLPLDIHDYPDYRFVKKSGEIVDYNGKKTEAEIIKFIIKNI